MDEYAEYKDELTAWYQQLYESCMDVLNSELDYGPDYYLTTTFETVTLEVLSNFASSFMMNNPQFYFLSNGYMYSWQETTPMRYALYLQIDSSFYKYSNRKALQDSLLLFEKDVTSQLTEDMNDYDKTLLIHDYLCDNNFYQYVNGKPDESLKSHSIWGIVDMDSETGTVCEGYAKAYQYLSNLIGLETISVVGYAGQTSLGGHAWNYTKINGVWYGVDVTWDDQDGYTYHDYFLCSGSFLENAGPSWNYGQHQAGASDITEGQSFFQVLLPELSEYAYQI